MLPNILILYNIHQSILLYYYTLIALHRCDSSRHILPRPRKCNRDITTFPSAVSPFATGSFPRCSQLLLMNPAPLSSKYLIHIVYIFNTYDKKSQSFFYSFIVTFLILCFFYSARYGFYQHKSCHWICIVQTTKIINITILPRF